MDRIDTTRPAFLTLTASVNHPPRWGWRPVGAKRNKATGLASRDEAVASLRAAGYVLVDRPIDA